MAPYILAENLGRKWESGDRIPDDLTVAPVQADVITVVLLCVVGGMKLSRYPPATGEISMSGKVGAITVLCILSWGVYCIIPLVC